MRKIHLYYHKNGEVWRTLETEDINFVNSEIAQMRGEAKAILHRCDEPHIVYGIKMFDEEGLKEVNFYDPANPEHWCSDERLDRVSKAWSWGAYEILAVHKQG